MNIQDESLSDEYNQSGNVASRTQTKEEKVDDGRCEHSCCRAVGKSSPPDKLGSGLVEKEGALRKEKTNAKIETDTEKSTTNTPVSELVDEPHIASEEDAP